MAGASKRAIYGAILANTAIAISKFIDAFFTGSSAMFSEGIHSPVDTGNGFLLLISVSLFFAIECQALLIGEGILSEDINKITTILEEEKHALRFRRPLSLYFGPSQVWVNLT